MAFMTSLGSGLPVLQADPDEQYPLLVFGRYLEGTDDQDEDEQVVDAQRVLDDPTGVEGDAVFGPRGEGECRSEEHRQQRVEAHPQSRFTGRRLAWPACHDHEVDADEADDHEDGRDPQPQGYVHGAVLLGGGERAAAVLTRGSGGRGRVYSCVVCAGTPVNPVRSGPALHRCP